MSINENSNDYARGVAAIERMTAEERKSARLTAFAAEYMGMCFFNGDETPGEIYEEIKREAWFCDRNYKNTAAIIESGEFVFE